TSAAIVNEMVITTPSRRMGRYCPALFRNCGIPIGLRNQRRLLETPLGRQLVNDALFLEFGQCGVKALQKLRVLLADTESDRTHILALVVGEFDVGIAILGELIGNDR